MKRRSFLDHVGWTGAGILFTLGGTGFASAPVAAAARRERGGSALTFVQISDSHIGFHQPPNEDVAGTLTSVVAAINALPQQPAFVMHTGDITHLSTAAQFDAAKQILASLKAPLLTIPGEHDTIGAESGRRYLEIFGRPQARDGLNDSGQGWYSWDQGGVHFVALVNVFNFEKMGLLGRPQLDWVAKDLAAVKRDTPVVVFGHVPLYALYPQWGWTTDDGAQALAQLARFASVTVLNGHIHQVISHTEGNLRFHTAASTAYPQPAPGTAEKPGPLQVPPDHLLAVLGYRSVEIGARARAQVIDHALV